MTSYARLFEILLVAAVYVCAAKIGQVFAISPGNVTPIWLPSGIMLAWAFCRGIYIWPGVFAGAFIGNSWAYLSTGTYEAVINTLLSASMNGAGDVIAIAGAAWAMHRLIQTQDPFSKLQNVNVFLFIGAVLGGLISALFGVTGLAAGGFISWVDYGYVLVTWWTGDAIGVVMLAPLFVFVCSPKGKLNFQNRLKETLFNAIIIIGILYVIIINDHGTPLTNFSMMAILPILIWATLRLDKRYVYLSILLVSGCVVIVTLQGRGPFGAEDHNILLIQLQLFIGILTTTFLYLSASREERDSAMRDLTIANLNLQGQVEIKAAEAKHENMERQLEAMERKRAEYALAENAAKLQGIFDNTPICMNLKDTSGRYILINKPYAKWYGLSPEDIIV